MQQSGSLPRPAVDVRVAANSFGPFSRRVPGEDKNNSSLRHLSRVEDQMNKNIDG